MGGLGYFVSLLTLAFLTSTLLPTTFGQEDDALDTSLQNQEMETDVANLSQKTDDLEYYRKQMVARSQSLENRRQLHYEKKRQYQLIAYYEKMRTDCIVFTACLVVAVLFGILLCACIHEGSKKHVHGRVWDWMDQRPESNNNRPQQYIAMQRMQPRNQARV